jgi:hypothetical protein
VSWSLVVAVQPQGTTVEQSSLALSARRMGS